jgi:hypothetical protein
MPDNHFSYGPVQYGFGQPQQPMDQSPNQQPYSGAGNLPNYGPPQINELRLIAILERLEHKLDSIFAILQTGQYHAPTAAQND